MTAFIEGILYLFCVEVLLVPLISFLGRLHLVIIQLAVVEEASAHANISGSLVRPVCVTLGVEYILALLLLVLVNSTLQVGYILAVRVGLVGVTLPSIPSHKS